MNINIAYLIFIINLIYLKNTTRKACTLQNKETKDIFILDNPIKSSMMVRLKILIASVKYVVKFTFAI